MCLNANESELKKKSIVTRVWTWSDMIKGVKTPLEENSYSIEAAAIHTTTDNGSATMIVTPSAYS